MPERATLTAAPIQSDGSIGFDEDRPELDASGPHIEGVFDLMGQAITNERYRNPHYDAWDLTLTIRDEPESAGKPPE